MHADVSKSAFFFSPGLSFSCNEVLYDSELSNSINFLPYGISEDMTEQVCGLIMLDHRYHGEVSVNRRRSLIVFLSVTHSGRY